MSARLLHAALLSADPAPSPAGAALYDFFAEFWPILIPVVLGLAAVYLLLPQVRRHPPLWGALLGGLALVVAGFALLRAEPRWEESVLFYAFAAVAVVAGGLLVTQRSPVRAALSFALVVLATCGLFLLQAAPFLMAATVIIYAGAIIVTFLFIIMLAQQAGLSNADERSREPFLSALAGFVLLGALLWVLHRNYDTAPLQALSGLDPYFARAEAASGARSVADMNRTLGGAEKFFDDFIKQVDKAARSSEAARQAVEQVKLRDTLLDAQQQLIAEPVPADAKRARLREVAAVGAQLHGLAYTRGSLQPSGRNLPLSGFSGVRPNLPVREVPRDRDGKPALPAANVAGLGRSLFTDYILGVELAGTLLLVATIGAIAIAGRRPEGLR